MNNPQKHKLLKVIGLILGILLALGVGLYFYVTSHTQIVVGVIQKGMYGNSSPNSFEPLYTPGKGLTAAGQYKINDIAYGTEYPNSFLDITYPDSNTETDRPTLFYFHGGGFFGGSKNMGDPMAASEATALLDDLCAQGYNIVNVDYALVPDHHFPVPLIQMNDAICFIAEHKDEYHINMDNVILMGSSAGAIMTAQYGTVLSSPEYAALLDIVPVLSLEQVAAVVIDDAPIDYENMTLNCKLLLGNYVKGSIYLNKDELNRYECIPHMTSDYQAYIREGKMSKTKANGDLFQKDLKAMVEGLQTNIEGVGIYIWEYAIDKDTKNTQHTIISSQVFEKLNGEKSVADWITDAINGNVQTYGLELLDKKY